jgi:hypothetical protein
MSSLAWGGLHNGQIPRDRILPAIGYAPLPGEPVGPLAGYLRADAAQQWAVMDSHYYATTGRHLTLSEGYRDLGDQKGRWNTYQAHGRPLAAYPGTSGHGWALSADVGTEGRAWMTKNGPRFGWVPTGKNFARPEPWHFDYVAGSGDITTPIRPADKPPHQEATDMNSPALIQRNDPKAKDKPLAAVGVEGSGYIVFRDEAHYMELANLWNATGTRLQTPARNLVTFPSFKQLGAGTHYSQLSPIGYDESLMAYSPR